MFFNKTKDSPQVKEFKKQQKFLNLLATRYRLDNDPAYLLITSENIAGIDTFENVVNGLIKHFGYKPLGGVSVSGELREYFAQAMQK
jgi:hypothetical protein